MASSQDISIPVPKLRSHYHQCTSAWRITSIAICIQTGVAVLLVIFLLAHCPVKESGVAIDETTKESTKNKRSPDLVISHTGLLQKQLPASSPAVTNSLGMEAIHLVGAVPVVHVKKNGTIGPWQQSNNDVTWATLSYDGSLVTIQKDGLYFIYAQIFYLTTEVCNSFEVTKVFGRERPREVLTVCAHQAAITRGNVAGAAEISCYTGVVAALKADDRLVLHQIEQNRVIMFSSGYSHWGLLRLQHT